MASLTGTQINNTYESLVKFTDNAAVTGTLKALTDGAGNTLPIEVSSTAVNFTGTVTGIPAAGMVSGTGTDSIQSAAALTTTSALAQGNNSIAIGDNAKAFADNSIVIGTSVNDADPVRYKAISIGNNLGTAQYTVNIGLDQNAYGANGVCIGENNTFGGDFNTAIGYDNSVTTYNNQVLLGSQATANGTSSVTIGHTAQTDSQDNIAIGTNARALGGGGFSRANIAIGKNAITGANSEGSTVIGANANGGTFPNNVALGVSAYAGANRAIAVGQSSQATAFNTVALGAYTNATQEGAIAIGSNGTTATATYSVAIGSNADATASDAVAIGQNVTASVSTYVTIKKLQMLDYASLNYADDTAAAAGGVPLGGVYHTSGALKVRIA